MTKLGNWETLACELNGDVAVLTLNRPDRLNVMNMAMREELWHCLLRVHDEPHVKALVITGAGTAFSAGGDMNDFLERTPEEMNKVIRDKSHRWFEALWRLPKPVIAAVNGVAAGGAVNLVLACDFVIASDRASFGETFVKVGLMPDLGGLFLLPRSVGLHRAKALCLSGELIDAERALEIGFVHKVVPGSVLMDEASSFAQRVAQGPAGVYATVKAALNRSFEMGMEQVLNFELYAQSYLFGTEQHRDLRQSFLDSSEGSGDGEVG